MRDNHGDPVYVHVNTDGGDAIVELEAFEIVGGSKDGVIHEYSAKKARKLAAKLLAAADQVEDINSLDNAYAAYAATVEPVRHDRSHGYQHGDVVLFTDVSAVIRYDADDDAWYSAGPEGHDCSNEFNHAAPGAAHLIARDGQPYNGTLQLVAKVTGDDLMSAMRRHIRIIGGCDVQKAFRA